MAATKMLPDAEIKRAKAATNDALTALEHRFSEAAVTAATLKAEFGEPRGSDG